MLAGKKVAVHSLMWKIFAIVMALGICTTLMLYIPYRNCIKTNYRERLVSVINMVDASHHDALADPAKLVEWVTNGEQEYWDLTNLLNQYVKIFDITYIYYVRPSGNTYEFVLSSEYTPDMPLNEIIESYEEHDVPNAMDLSYKTKSSQITPKPHTDSYGTFVSAYIPIMNGETVVGVLGADYEIAKVRQSERRIQTLLTIIMIVGVTATYLLALSIIRPVRKIEKFADSIANMNLNVDIDKFRKDEIGSMQRTLLKVRDNLKVTIEATQKQVKNLSGTSESLLGLSGNLSASSETTLKQSMTVSKKSEETSGNVTEIAGEAERASATATELSATAEQMGKSMTTMVEAVGEMHESFGKITAETRESKTVAGIATEKVAGAMGVIDALGSSAREIGQFTDIIKSIAKKTNLLALNATVEAARAGEAGKGFAVVAGEVKQLANQSASNADDITHRIENIQKGTENAIDSIKEISAIITKISASAHSISESIEKQIKVSDNLASTARDTNVGTQQVVKAVDDVANSIQIAAKHAGDAAEGTKNVTDSICVIREDAEKTNAYSTQLKETANSMRAMAEGLDTIVSKFRT
jgi:methyl-accepting chemotaxis protein